MTTDTRKAAINKLDYFIKNGLNKYSSERNFDFGPTNVQMFQHSLHILSEELSMKKKYLKNV